MIHTATTSHDSCREIARKLNRTSASRAPVRSRRQGCGQGDCTTFFVLLITIGTMQRDHQANSSFGGRFLVHWAQNQGLSPLPVCGPQGHVGCRRPSALPFVLRADGTYQSVSCRTPSTSAFDNSAVAFRGPGSCKPPLANDRSRAKLAQEFDDSVDWIVRGWTDSTCGFAPVDYHRPSRAQSRRWDEETGHKDRIPSHPSMAKIISTALRSLTRRRHLKARRSPMIQKDS
jgi:hypothetical protein